MNYYFCEKYGDLEYGNYYLIARIEENGLIYEWRDYISKKGDRYANYCSNGSIEFHKSPCIRDKRFPNFVKEQEGKTNA